MYLFTELECYIGCFYSEFDTLLTWMSAHFTFLLLFQWTFLWDDPFVQYFYPDKVTRRLCSVKYWQVCVVFSILFIGRYFESTQYRPLAEIVPSRPVIAVLGLSLLITSISQVGGRSHEPYPTTVRIAINTSSHNQYQVLMEKKWVQIILIFASSMFPADYSTVKVQKYLWGFHHLGCSLQIIPLSVIAAIHLRGYCNK